MDSIRQRKSGKEKLLSNSISSGFSEILIFMIVNPISGSNEGVAYTQLNKSNFDFTVGDGINVNLKIANLVEEGQVDDVKEEISGLLNARAQRLVAKLIRIIFNLIFFNSCNLFSLFLAQNQETILGMMRD